MKAISLLLIMPLLLLAETDDLGTMTVGDAPEENYLRSEGFLEGAAAQKTLSTKESLSVPGAGGDPIKGLSSLAGIVNVNDASGELIIHGTRPRESKVVYNQLPVGFLYHWGGLFSTVPPEAIEQLDAYLGGFDVSYGEALGGVIDITPRYPTGSGSGFVHGGLYDASFGYDFKISDQTNGFVAARRSYVDLFVDPDSFSVDKTTVSQVPQFWDTTAIVAGYRGNHLFTAEFFAGLDELEVDTQDMENKDPAATGEIDLSNGYASLGLRWLYDNGQNYSANTLLYYSRIQIDSGFFDNTIDYLSHSTGLVHKSTHRYDEGRRFQWGFETVNHRLPLQYDGVLFGESEGQEGSMGGLEPVTIDRTLTRDDYALFAQEIVPLSQRWALRYGLRSDYLQEEWVPSPRAALVWQASTTDTLSLSAGRYTQSPEGYMTTRELGSEDLKAEKGNHYILGYTRRFDTHTTLSVEPYYKEFFDLTVYDPGERFKSVGEGRSKGIDMTFKRQFDGLWNLMATYSYIQAERDTNSSSGLQPFYGEIPHVFQLIGSKKLESGWLKGWDFGARVQYHTGTRYTPLTRGGDGKNYTVQPCYDTAVCTTYKQPNYGEPFSEKLPDYLNVNLRIAKNKKLSSGERLEMSFELINLLMRENASDIDYDDEYEKKGYVSQMPFLPWFDLTLWF